MVRGCISRTDYLQVIVIILVLSVEILQDSKAFSSVCLESKDRLLGRNYYEGNLSEMAQFMNCTDLFLVLTSEGVFVVL